MAGPSKSIIASSSFGILKNLLVLLFILKWTRISYRQLKGYGFVGTADQAFRYIQKRVFSLIFLLPPVKAKIIKDVREAKHKIETKLTHVPPEFGRYRRLPAQGWDADKINKELEALSEMKRTRWEDGLVSGAVYHGGSDLQAIQVKAFERFTVANPLHPDVFPAVRKMEAEIVAMVLSMFHAPETGAGVTTSGGTESIIMACYAARCKAFKERGITAPEMILPETAHTAFHKAADYFKIKLHLVPCKAPSYKVHIPSVARLINSNTVLLVGSAPNFPHGIIDDITSLSRLGLRHNIPLHVDCCLGSFIIPFLHRAGFPTEPFDFRVPGVSSISCDTHKYGFAPKGNSTILYRTSEYRAYQYFVSPDWSGGVYASPSIAGSRPGALIAGCWASMMNQGEQGYVQACHTIVGATKRFEAAIREDDVLSDDLDVVGRPLVSVVAFTSSSLNIYDIADAMSAKGWHLNALQSPAAIHVALTLPIVRALDKLIADLKDVVLDEKAKEQARAAAGKKKKGAATGDTAALYGVAGSLPDKRVVVQLAHVFLDTLYKV